MFKFTHSAKRIIRQLFCIAAIPFLLLVITPTGAMACHKGTPHGNQTDCGGPDPGSDPPPSATETVIALTGGIVSEAAPPWDPGRPCSQGALFTATQGEYNCLVSAYPGIMIDTISMTGVFNKKAAPLCMSLTHHDILQPSQGGFQYGWTDNCLDGDCAIEIRMVFEGQQILDRTGGQSDLLDVVFHATLDTQDGVQPDSNPFYHSREADIHSIDLDFRATGSDRSIATCTFYPPMACSQFPEPGKLISIPVSGN